MRAVQKVLELSLIILCMTLVTISTDAANSGGFATVFEKGDAIYSDMGEDRFLGFLGHCGLYWEWVDISGEEPNDPKKLETHKIIEASGYRHGVRESDFKKFYDCGEFWGVYTCHGLTATQRQFIVDMAKIQKGCEYVLSRGYKNPSDYDEYGNRVLGSFRCDGLVEYCYEIAFGHPWEPGNNRGLVFNDTWRSLRPNRQMNSPLFFRREDAIVKEVRLEPSEDGTPKAYASDGGKGSGITMVEFWDGMPDDTPFGGGDEDISGKRLGWDVHDVKYTEGDDAHTYEYYYHGTPIHHLHVKAFDQAGNTKVASMEMAYTIICLPPYISFGSPPTPVLKHRAQFGEISYELVDTQIGEWYIYWHSHVRRYTFIYNLVVTPQDTSKPPETKTFTITRYEHKVSSSTRVWMSGASDPTFESTEVVTDGLRSVGEYMEDWCEVAGIASHTLSCYIDNRVIAKPVLYFKFCDQTPDIWLYVPPPGISIQMAGMKYGMVNYHAKVKAGTGNPSFWMHSDFAPYAINDSYNTPSHIGRKVGFVVLHTLYKAIPWR